MKQRFMRLCWKSQYSSIGSIRNEPTIYVDYLMKCIPGLVQQATIYKDEITLHTSPTRLIPLLNFLKCSSTSQYKQLVEITAVDYPAKAATGYRFDVIYCLLSHAFSSRIIVKTYAGDEVKTGITSCTSLFESANWLEREVWDMFGIVFNNHPDLRRILTDYGFKGHPLRKDFPLTGFTEVRWDEEKKRVVEDPLEMTQEYRRFDLSSPWDQMQRNKPSRDDSNGQ